MRILAGTTDGSILVVKEGTDVFRHGVPVDTGNRNVWSYLPQLRISELQLAGARMVFAADLRVSLGQLNWAFPITALFWVASASEGDFMIGYLKTLVHCAIPAGSVPAPRFSPEWTKRMSCNSPRNSVAVCSALDLLFRVSAC